MLTTQKFLIACLLAIAVATVQVHSAASTSKATPDDGYSVKRSGRIMKILKNPKLNNPKRLVRPAQSPQISRNRERFAPPPPGPPSPQRAVPLIYHRNPVPVPVQPPFSVGPRNQVIRRVQNGPPPNILLRPPQSQPQQQQHLLNFEHEKGARYPFNAKDNAGPLALGKGAVYRPHFTAGSHPNALPPQPGPSGNPQQFSQLNHFKPSPEFSGSAIVRPASYYPNYAKLLQEYGTAQDIQQYPLPEHHPQHELQGQQQHQQQRQQQQQTHQQFQQFPNQRPSADTAPQTFPPLNQQSLGTTYTEQLRQPTNNGNTAQKMYSVYEDPEFNNQPPHNSGEQSTSQQQQQQQHASSEAQQPKEAEDYLKFMSTNEYFLPKFNPNYKKLDEEKDQRQYRQQLKSQKQHQQQHQHQQQQQQLQYSKAQAAAVDTSGAATFQHPIEVSQLFYQPDSSPASSTVVHGSYQTGNNAFVVKSDGKKATKHVIPNSVGSVQGVTTSPSSVTGSYGHLHFNSQRQRTPEPIRFEFTERDAVLAAYTNAPPLSSSSNGHLRYKGVNTAHQSINSVSHQNVYNVQTASIPSATSVIYNHQPISVNEVDSDPEDGDDMHDTGTGTFGRVLIRTSTESSGSDSSSGSGSAANDPTPTTPPIEQKDTEEYCERMCANVQDEDEDIVCGSDGYMYTSEAQMECYASCLHIDVTIQGKGTCSAR